MNGEGSVKDVDFLPKNEELRVQAKQRKENYFVLFDQKPKDSCGTASTYTIDLLIVDYDFIK